jgi:uncharacterized low-complexity protein
MDKKQLISFGAALALSLSGGLTSCAKDDPKVSHKGSVHTKTTAKKCGSGKCGAGKCGAGKCGGVKQEPTTDVTPRMEQPEDLHQQQMQQQHEQMQQHMDEKTLPATTTNTPNPPPAPAPTDGGMQGAAGSTSN